MSGQNGNVLLGYTVGNFGFSLEVSGLLSIKAVGVSINGSNHHNVYKYSQ